MGKRCPWCLSDPIYIKYHDQEWGKAEFNDQKLFEMLVLELMQAGLSWLTVLKKRDSFRQAYDNFNIEKVAKYDEKKIQELLQNSQIIRNEIKIRSSVWNANRVMDVQKEFGSFANYLWNFVNKEQIINDIETLADLPASSELSDTITKDLKGRSFKFIGTKIIYSFLQAVGIIDDHINDCSFKATKK